MTAGVLVLLLIFAFPLILFGGVIFALFLESVRPLWIHDLSKFLRISLEWFWIIDQVLGKNCYQLSFTVLFGRLFSLSLMQFCEWSGGSAIHKVFISLTNLKYDLDINWVIYIFVKLSKFRIRARLGSLPSRDIVVVEACSIERTGRWKTSENWVSSFDLHFRDFV
jgi:hypothetical protein